MSTTFMTSYLHLPVPKYFLLANLRGIEVFKKGAPTSLFTCCIAARSILHEEQYVHRIKETIIAQWCGSVSMLFAYERCL